MSFSDRTKLIIAFSCGNCCAKCFKALVYRDNEAIAYRGQAAHIAGEKPGAARYDPLMSEDDRDSPENGLYLCRDCHDLIDNVNTRNSFSTDDLKKLKREHEKRVNDAMSNALSRVTFAELDQVCKELLANAKPASSSSDDSYDVIGIEKKIKVNNFSNLGRNYINMGLSLYSQVESFVEDAEKREPGYGERLRDGFLAEYYAERKNGARGDELYQSLINLVDPMVFEDKMSVNAVIAYLFTKCEVFEK